MKQSGKRRTSPGHRDPQQAQGHHERPPKNQTGEQRQQAQSHGEQQQPGGASPQTQTQSDRLSEQQGDTRQERGGHQQG